MSALLEVVVTHAADAQRAEAGGADRLSLIGDAMPGLEREAGALSPERCAVANASATARPWMICVRSIPVAAFTASNDERRPVADSVARWPLAPSPPSTVMLPTRS